MAITIISIILCLLVIFLLAPIEVRLCYQETFSFSLYFCGTRIPMDKEKKKEVKKKIKKAEEKVEEKAEKSFVELLSFKEKIELVKKLLSKFKKYSRKKIKIKELEVLIEYGTEDAAKTAILTGSFWAILYGILPVLDQVFRVLKHQFSVTPMYNRKTFSLHAQGIIKTRPVHIMFIGTVLMVQFLRYKKSKKAVLKNE